MNWSLTTPCTLILGLAIGSTVGLPGTAQSQTRSSQPPQSAAPSAPTPYQHQETWYEFVLRQFNPDDVDYGRWIERERQAFIEARLKNPYFLYSLCTTLVLLSMAVVCAKLRIDHRRAMWITAEMMADIYNHDAYSRRIAQEAIEKYNTHIERCNRAIETEENGGAASATGSEIEQLKSELTCVASERDMATSERDLAAGRQADQATPFIARSTCDSAFSLTKASTLTRAPFGSVISIVPASHAAAGGCCTGSGFGGAGTAGSSDAGPSMRPTGMNSTFSGAPIATAAALCAVRQL